MTHHVVLTRRAECELEDAAAWWAENRSPDQAARWYAGFSEAIASLEREPHGCPLAPENGSFPYEIRELHYGLGSRLTHRAVFTIRPDMVLVLAIRHVAQAELTQEDLP
jgi:plasmid stabilization system protein ParE